MSSKLATKIDEVTAAVPPSKKGATPLWQQAVAAVLVIVLSYAVLEITFAAAGLGESDLVHLDPVFGFAPVPNKSITWRGEGYSRYRYNSFGMQDDERTLAKPADTYRVAMLGDSYTEAFQVPREKNHCSILQSLLNQDLKANKANEAIDRDKSKVEVLNFAVASYSLGMMYMQLKQNVERFHPDMVVLEYHVNEVMKVEPPAVPIEEMGLGYCHPYFRIGKGGELVTDTSIQEKWFASRQAKTLRETEWLTTHSRVAAVSVHAYRQVADAISSQFEKLRKSLSHEGAAPQMQASYWVDQAPYSFTKSHWAVMDLLIQKMNEECKKNGIKFAIVRIPAFRYNDNPAEAELLRQSAERLQIPYRDMDAATRKLTDEKLAEMFIGGNGHFNATGHEYVGAQLKSFLSEVQPDL
ncbi:MAG: hypothetical protein K2X81_15355 [Candidatus Obscuribacterales bacterium]|nr:hypothetical protein [Candidatus Obscuribacterales bacterium]